LINIGIVGAENSHTVAIARVVNREAKVRGARVTHVWGERAVYAQRAASEGDIPHIVREPIDLIGAVDAVVVDHRHAKYHLPAARPLLEAKLPLFIDKPFCYRLVEGQRFLKRAHELAVPVTSFSTLPHQRAFKEFARKVRKLGRLRVVVATGPCEIRSPWGGVFFYGIHQVDMALRLLGYGLSFARLTRGRGKTHVANLGFKGGELASFNLVGGREAEFHLSAIGERGRVDQLIEFDESPYLAGIRTFVKTFRTGRTDETEESMLGPVAALQALEQSLAEGGRSVRIRKSR
jgi:predicted dehydrogenase